MSFVFVFIPCFIFYTTERRLGCIAAASRRLSRLVFFCFIDFSSWVSYSISLLPVCGLLVYTLGPSLSYSSSNNRLSIRLTTSGSMGVASAVVIAASS